jgi:hypothetical protein
MPFATMALKRLSEVYDSFYVKVFLDGLIEFLDKR